MPHTLDRHTMVPWYKSYMLEVAFEELQRRLELGDVVCHVASDQQHVLSCWQ
jgi:hypothetical protein